MLFTSVWFVWLALHLSNIAFTDLLCNRKVHDRIDCWLFAEDTKVVHDLNI